MKKPWFLDNGYSRHMTSDKSLFQELDDNRQYRKKHAQITCYNCGRK